MPIWKGKWRINSIFRVQTTTASNAAFATFASGGWGLTVPVGVWTTGYQLPLFNGAATAVFFTLSPTSITGVASGSEDTRFTTTGVANGSGVATDYTLGYASVSENVTSTSTYLLYAQGATASAAVNADQGLAEIRAELELL